MISVKSIAGGSIVEGSNGLATDQLVFTITLAEALPVSQELRYYTENGTATSGLDYTAIANSLTNKVTFAPGETAKTISVEIKDDELNEPDESFIVRLIIPKATYLNPSPTTDILGGVAGGNISDFLKTASTTTLSMRLENLELTGTANINGTGNSKSNIILGNTKNNVLEGLEGNDTLNGKAGADTLKGGTGNDLYIVDATDVIEEPEIGGGDDTVETNITYTLGAHLENLVLTGAANRTGKGNSLNNKLVGNAGSNLLEGFDGEDILDGKGGADTLKGGTGDDTYRIDNQDVIEENASEGEDTIEVNYTYTLTVPNVENIRLIGTQAINATGDNNDNRLTGNNNSNYLIGNNGNDVLEGGGGVDTLEGGNGNDVYVLDITEDIIIEIPSGGLADTVVTPFSYVLGDNLENLILQIGAGNIEGIGNSLDNTITGNESDNFIDGGTGSDIMIGLGGNDYYIVDSIEDQIQEEGNTAGDVVEVSINNYTLGPNLNHLILVGTVKNGTGNEQNNYITGNNENNNLIALVGLDTLDGGLGLDTLEGGSGNDLYYVDQEGDVINETLNNGADTVRASSTYTLMVNVEDLILEGTANLNGTGNSEKNKLFGNSGNNTLTGLGEDDTLDGGIGKDTLIGGEGNDLYKVDNFKDQVTEIQNQGIDKVESSVTHKLSNHVDNLTLTGASPLNGTGNNLDNIILGNTNKNTIDGQGGNDSLKGGGGNDILIGGNGNDTLDGEVGDDTLVGGSGNDIYVVGSTLDVIAEDPSSGTDEAQSTATTYTLGDNVENLTLLGTVNINGTGNSQNNLIKGNTGSNVIDGSVGKDTLEGGNGNDIYVVDNAEDVVTEINTDVNQLDTVRTAINNYVLPDNVEILILEGIANLIGSGNNLNNSLTGNNGNNKLLGLDGKDTLDGGVGNDTLIGGNGDDTYIVDQTTDVITEGVNQGKDTALASANYTLGNNVDNLTLLGTNNLNGTGNTLNNLLNGNSGNNTLEGKAGDDILTGNAGDDILVGNQANDTLIGGAGADKFSYNTGVAYSGADLGGDKINDFNSNEADKIILGKTTFALTSNAGNGFSNSTEFASVTTDNAAKASAARIVYSSETGNLFYNDNGTTVGAESIITTLNNIPSSLAASNFIIEL